ncbi:MAG TPA: GNAT family N-acetyltransferase [Burkholderiales bacterium]|nr:GNAT family N-acetyltransferase [Burkholderiales bacterium]
MAWFKNRLRAIAYGVGVYGLIHRVRNRHTLTVFMFHRVLPRSSTAFASAEREFTLCVENFARSLDFIQKHYHVIDLDHVARAREGKRPLPTRAALITFDDGWRDSLEFAYAELRRRRMPCVVFVASEVLNTEQPVWWQDLLVSALAESTEIAELKTLFPPLGEGRASAPIGIQEYTAELARHPLADRYEMLRRYAPCHAPGRQMLTAHDVQEADRTLVEFGGHGHTHAPLTHVDDVDGELNESFTAIANVAGKVRSMSFPHGAFDESVVMKAASAGFEMLFSSEPVLNRPQTQGRVPGVFGRVHLPENQWTCDGLNISHPKLATFMFFRPQRNPCAPRDRTSIPVPRQPEAFLIHALPGRAHGDWSGVVKRMDDLTQQERDAWRKIQQEHPEYQSPFFSAEFSAAVANASRQVRVCLLHFNGRLCGFWPFQFANDFARWCRAAERVGSELNDSCGVILDTDIAPTIDAVTLLACAGLSHFLYSHLDERQLELGLAGAEPRVGASISLPDGSDSYWSGVRQRHRGVFNNIKNRQRKAEKDFKRVAFTFDQEHSWEWLQVAISQKREQYRVNGVPDALAEAWKGHVLENLRVQKSPGCALVLSTLEFDGVWAAVHIGLRSFDRLHYWFPVYNPALRGYSPGLLLLSNIIEESGQHGVSHIDLGEGKSQYKDWFATEEYRVFRGAWSASDIRSIAYRVQLSAGWRLSRYAAALK